MLAFSIAATKPSYKDGRYEGCGKTRLSRCCSPDSQSAARNRDILAVSVLSSEKKFLKLALEQKQEKFDFFGVLSVGP